MGWNRAIPTAVYHFMRKLLMVIALAGCGADGPSGEFEEGTTSEGTTTDAGTGDYCPGYPNPVTPECWDPVPDQCSTPGRYIGDDGEHVPSLLEECPPCPYEGHGMERACTASGVCGCATEATSDAGLTWLICPWESVARLKIEDGCTREFWPAPGEYVWIAATPDKDDPYRYWGDYPCQADSDCPDLECIMPADSDGWAGWGTCWNPNYGAP